MAIAFVRNHTAGTSSTNNATVSATLAANVPAGNTLVLWVVSDNTNINQPFISSITVESGETHTWDIGGTLESSQAGAAGGVVGTPAIIKTSVQWNSGSTVTVTLSGSVTKKAVLIQEFSGVGFDEQFNTPNLLNSSATTNNSTGGTPTVTLTSVPQDSLMVGFGAFEQNAAATGDSDTVNGSWSTAYTAFTTGGGSAANVSAIMQHKIVTATGNQTYNPTGTGDSGVYARNWSQFNIFAATATLTQAQTLSVVGAVAQIGVAALAQDQSLTATAGITRFGAMDLSQASALTAAGAVVLDASGSLSQGATLTVSGANQAVASSGLTEGSSLAADATVIPAILGSASLGSVSSLTVAATNTANASSTLVNSSVLAATATVTALAESALAQDSALIASALVTASAATTLSQVADLTVAGAAMVVAGTAALAQDDVLVVGASLNVPAVAALAQPGALSATAIVYLSGDANFASTSALNAVGDVTVPGVAILAQNSSLNGLGTNTANGGAALTQPAVMTSSAVMTKIASTTLPAWGSIEVKTGHIWHNNFNGGTNGVQLTSSQAASNGDSVGLRDGVYPTYTSSPAMGALAVQSPSASTSTMVWGTTNGKRNMAAFARMCIYIPAHTATIVPLFSAGGMGGQIAIRNDGKFTAQAVAGSPSGELSGGAFGQQVVSTSVVPSGQWVRFECGVTNYTTSSFTFVVRYFSNATSAIVTEELPVTNTVPYNLVVRPADYAFRANGNNYAAIDNIAQGSSWLGPGDVPAAAWLDGYSTLVADVAITATCSLDASSQLTATGDTFDSSTALLVQDSTLSATPSLISHGESTMSAASSLTSAGSTVVEGAAEMTGSASLLGAGQANQAASIALEATGDISPAANITRYGEVNVTSSSNLLTTALVGVLAGTSLSQAAALTAQALLLSLASVELTGAAAMTCDGVLVQSGDVTLDSFSALVAVVAAGIVQPVVITTVAFDSSVISIETLEVGVTAQALEHQVINTDALDRAVIEIVREEAI